MRDIAITDLTYMRGGFCIAGIDVETLENIRPVLNFGAIQKEFVDRNKIYPGALVSFDFSHKKPKPPHIEDYVFNPEKTTFIKFLSQSEWLNILNSCSSTSLAYAFSNLIIDRKGIQPDADAVSLALIKVDSLKVNFFDSDSGAVLPFKVRVSFTSGGELYHLPVTDMQFIDYCNERFSEGIRRDKFKADIEKLINESEYILLRIGLTRPFKKADDTKELCYLQVNGIYSESLDNEIRYILSNETRDFELNEQKTFVSDTLQFKIFNIPLTNDDREMELLNAFLCDVEVKRFSASVVDNKFWSILLGYISAPKNKRKESIKNEKISCESLSELTSDDMEIYERLRKWRSNKAQILNVPEYFIFSNKTLMTMAKIRPLTLDMLLNISGIGEKKVKDYGDEVLGIING
ncbi:MAG: HRDC domain-containing protein [Thermodesulfovibrionales bacterium]